MSENPNGPERPGPTDPASASPPPAGPQQPPVAPPVPPGSQPTAAYPTAAYPPPGQQPTADGQAGYPPSAPRGTDRGFMGSLFDVSFVNYITPKVVSVVYVIGMVVIGLVWLTYIAIGFSQAAGWGILALILGGIVAFLYLIFFRITLEFFVAVVASAETIQKYARRDGIR
jgi:hypothetical protein